MNSRANVMAGRDALQHITNSYRPLGVAENGLVALSGYGLKDGVLVPNGQPIVNSVLFEDEWEAIDRAVLPAARYPLGGVADLRAAGLVEQIGSIGTLMATWYMSSEITAAQRNMTGRSRGDRDLPDMTQAGVPLPVTFKEFAVDLRFLEASRLLGNGIDTTTSIEAARVVAESLEYMLFNGDSGVNFQGSVVYGYTTHPNRSTAAVGSFGGGDWGTPANVVATVAGMLRSASNTNRHYGPYNLYVSETQYDEAAQTYFSDGSNGAETALMRLKRTFGMGADGTKQISEIKKVPAPMLADGNVLLVQMSSDVVTWAETLAPMTREWRTGDGMEVNWRVMTIAAPKIKARADGKSGIIHATGA
jgi:uncharacterized linocin/CFP29 family protein